MLRILLSSLLFLSIAEMVSAEMYQPNCTDNKDGRKLACYSCMGRDMENCDWGLTCCKGSCFKLIDNDHELIVKGCTNGGEEDASMKVRELDVKLYWDKNAKVKGESYFCKGTEFCNSSPSSLFSLLFVPLIARLL
ncbi:hypothetical protein PRIPAC_81213 [Pristionchus pacificus]|uniref:Uncharacterized protein n=1 Tax=Pristionchus pacificus TaxID=54126 RepID=A0A8R1V5Q5_PRIPA|nr:hypothetical protein PRIPAC_81213 [Pristionchus pacificus]